MLDKQDVRGRIADALKEHMGIDPALALEDKTFSELHQDFDSLAFLELQLLLEKEFGMEFDGFDANARIPRNVSELADAVIHEHARYHARRAKPTTTTQPSSSREAISH